MSKTYKNELVHEICAEKLAPCIPGILGIVDMLIDSMEEVNGELRFTDRTREIIELTTLKKYTSEETHRGVANLIELHRNLIN